MIAVGSKGLPHNIFYAKTTLGKVVCCDGGGGGGVKCNCKQTADREEQWILLASCFKLIKNIVKMH
jgi:hypothetical protein